MKTMGERVGWLIDTIASGNQRALGRFAGLENEQHVGVYVQRLREKPDAELNPETMRTMVRNLGLDPAWFMTGEGGPHAPFALRPVLNKDARDSIERLRDLGMTDEEIAARIGRPASVLQGILAGAGVTIDVYQALARALGKPEGLVEAMAALEDPSKNTVGSVQWRPDLRIERPFRFESWASARPIVAHRYRAKPEAILSTLLASMDAHTFHAQEDPSGGIVEWWLDEARKRLRLIEAEEHSDAAQRADAISAASKSYGAREATAEELAALATPSRSTPRRPKRH